MQWGWVAFAALLAAMLAAGSVAYIRSLERQLAMTKAQLEITQQH